jgi:hypothetical protein
LLQVEKVALILSPGVKGTDAARATVMSGAATKIRSASPKAPARRKEAGVNSLSSEAPSTIEKS